jgi:hypothetical protein
MLTKGRGGAVHCQGQGEERGRDGGSISGSGKTAVDGGHSSTRRVGSRGPGITQGTATSNSFYRTIGGPATERHPRDDYNAAGCCPLPKLRTSDAIPAESRPHQGGAGTNEAPPTALKVCMRDCSQCPWCLSGLSVIRSSPYSDPYNQVMKVVH